MAKFDTPTGFKPFMQSGKTPRITRYYHSAATAIFKGDPVVKTGEAHTDLDSTLFIEAAGATGEVTGVAANYAKANEGTYVDVYDHPLQEFIGQADTGHTPVIADMGRNCDLVAGGGSTTTELSAYELDFNTIGTGADLSAKIRSLDKRVDNVIGVPLEHLAALEYENLSRACRVGCSERLDVILGDSATTHRRTPPVQ